LVGSIAELIGGEELVLVRDFFSLSEYEARVYITLILSGPANISRISQLSGVPRTKCYSVVRSLISKGLAMRVSTKPLIVDAIKPEIASNRHAEDLCASARERAVRLVEAMNRLLEKAGSRSPKGKSGQEIAGVTFIETMDGLVSVLIDDIERASKEILIATSNMPIEFPWRELMAPSMKAMARGVAIEYAAPKGSPVLRHIKTLLEELSKLGQQQAPETGLGTPLEALSRFRVYESEHIEAPFIVIDEEVVYNIFTDPVRRAYIFTIRVYNPRYAKSMKIYYRLLTRG